MKEKWNFILYLLWFSYLIMSAVLMFGQGFLLSRKTLSDVTECVPLSGIGCDGRETNTSQVSCSENEKIRRILSNPGAPIVCAGERNRVMFVLVDALRYDFTDFDEGLVKPLPYQNRLPVIRRTLERWPDRARLFRFMADPPTTTLQRIKALITGSLPTFIDVSSNFAAVEMQEDNTIDQLFRTGGKAVLLGDDTWSRIIPGRWMRSHAMYSFHTWDLDTVDLEIDSKIYDEALKSDWDLLLAHYLGVDHAGHRYGPNHPEMTRKLDETNARLEKIIEMLPPDALLYVIGDHGMTETDWHTWNDGDHGGESKAERTAAFFAYRGAGLSDVDTTPPGSEVQQTDFTPTVSAALGMPPPAPSLGNLQLSVLPKTTVPVMLLQMTNVLKQISQYLVRYGEESTQVPLDKLAVLINATREQMSKASAVETVDELNVFIADVKALVNTTRSIFREVWVEFDSLSMLRALLLFILAIFFNWLITEGLPIDRVPLIFASSFVPTGYISMAVCIGICYTAFYFQLIENVLHSIILSTGIVSGVLTGALVVMHWDGISTRWYEGRSTFYERFARGALIASAVVLLSNSYIIEEGAGLAFLSLSVLGLMAWNVGTLKAAGLWACFGVVLACSRPYRGCREEQGDCWTSGGAANREQASRAALVLALGSVAGFVAVGRRATGWRGLAAAAAGLLACAHWAVGWGALGSAGRSRLLARAAWLALAAGLALLWRRDGRGAVLPLLVCSLLIYVANTLVLGAAYAPAAALALLSGYLALNIVALLKNDGSAKSSMATRCNCSVACLWVLLGSYHFYGTGHHATIGHIRWAPAFHAGDPHYTGFGPPIIGLFVMLELFGMPLLFGAAAPLLALWRGAGAAGARAQLTAVFLVCLKFALCFAIRSFVCALSATIHCRHLMVWGVFTPKLLFEAGACGAALLGALAAAALAVWHTPTHQRNS
ncbi:uncharacterized protein LOC134655521 [Cydia amplana]|uniref:uncharacterized protein LOC134655521 n=1 Tax=Cydia amplana TaxID=1869771 RepID=UPI002FE68BAB